MNKNEWWVIAAIVISLVVAFNILWAAIKSSLEWGIPSASTVNVLGVGVLALPIAIAVGLLAMHFRSGGDLKPPSKREGRGFAAIVLVSAVACYLLWIWIRVPPEVGSPALSVMSVYGFGVVALPTVFHIGLLGVHFLSRRKEK